MGACSPSPPYIHPPLIIRDNVRTKNPKKNSYQKWKTYKSQQRLTKISPKHQKKEKHKIKIIPTRILGTYGLKRVYQSDKLSETLELNDKDNKKPKKKNKFTSQKKLSDRNLSRK